MSVRAGGGRRNFRETPRVHERLCDHHNTLRGIRIYRPLRRTRVGQEGRPNKQFEARFVPGCRREIGWRERGMQCNLQGELHNRATIPERMHAKSSDSSPRPLQDSYPVPPEPVPTTHVEHIEDHSVGQDAQRAAPADRAQQHAPRSSAETLREVVVGLVENKMGKVSLVN